jgi:hypothetical protein
MAKYKVYHAINPDFIAKDPIDFPKGFKHVANVETDDGFEKVFEVTNHIYHDWTTNPEVKWSSGTGAHTRSTSVGDIVLDEVANKKYLCLMAGWQEIKS